MNAKSLIKQAIVALNFPKVISNFIVYAKAIAQALTDNPRFASSAAKVADLNEDIQALDAAVTGFKTVPQTKTIQERDAALEKVQADLRLLRNDVEELANSDPANAELVIASAGMTLKKSTPHANQQNTAEPGIEEGSVRLTAEGAGAHEWRWSVDEKVWMPLPASLTSKTTVNNMPVDTLLSIQNRRMLRNNEKGEWSQSVKIKL